jgi:DNA invertase Pin-like site-specific DNA recombinase
MSRFMSYNIVLHHMTYETQEFNMARIGYARVSSYGQSLELQKEKLNSASVDRVFSEKQSARTADDRQELQLCLDYVRDGDVLVVTKLDRLARSTRDLLNIANKLEKKKVSLVVLDQQIDTSNAAGKLLFTMLGAIAEFENDIRKDRQVQGVELARKKGIQFGRKKALSTSKIDDLKAKRLSGVMIKDLMKEFKLSKATIYRYLK